MTPAIEAAKARADATDYVRKHGPDPTYWTHFLSWREGSDRATAADYLAAYELVLATAPEATHLLDHLRTMREIVQEGEQLVRS